MLYFLFLFSLSYIFKPNDTFISALTHLGLTKEEKEKIINVIKDEVNINKCKPGYKIYIEKKGNKILEFKYITEDELVLIDSVFNIKKMQAELRPVYIKGKIQSSLWESILKAGGTPFLVDVFANEIFVYDIDFYVEPRNGDEFEILSLGKYLLDEFKGFDKIIFAKYKTGDKEYVAISYPLSHSTFYDPDGFSLSRLFLRSPLKYTRISSKFSFKRFHPILHKWMPHPAIDYAAPYGTFVRSVGDGIVTFAGWNKGFGKQVIIQHKNGYKTYYGHLSKIFVKKGMKVNQGEVIGSVGMTGLATGPHLDFRMKKYDKWINPLKLNFPRKEKLTGEELKNYEKYKEQLFTLIKAINTLQKLSINEFYFNKL